MKRLNPTWVKKMVVKLDGGLFMGVPFDDMNPDELKAVIACLSDLSESLRHQNAEDLKLLLE